jgi:zinc protease
LINARRIGGSENYPLNDKENALVAAKLVYKMGVNDFTPNELNHFTQNKSIYVQPFINNYDEGIQGITSKKELESCLQLINLYYTKPRKDEIIFNQLKSNNEFNYLDDFKLINLDRIFEIYTQIFGNAFGTHFSLVGNIDTNSIKPLLETYLGSLPWEPKEIIFPYDGNQNINPNTKTVVKNENEKPTFLIRSFEGNLNHDVFELIKIQMLSDLLNLNLNKKLNNNKIEKSGNLPYVSFKNQIFYQYNLTISLPCESKTTQKLNEDLNYLINKLQTVGSNHKDFIYVKKRIKNTLTKEKNTNKYWIEYINQQWLNNMKFNNINSNIEIVEKLTNYDIIDAANKYLKINHVVNTDLNYN